MISHASTKSFMITFASKLRVRASTSNIDVVIVDPDFINSRIAKAIGANTAKHGGPQLMAALMKDALEMGGVGVVNLPISHSVKVYALRGKFKISPLRFPWRLTLVSFWSPESHLWRNLELDGDECGTQEDDAIWLRHFRLPSCFNCIFIGTDRDIFLHIELISPVPSPPSILYHIISTRNWLFRLPGPLSFTSTQFSVADVLRWFECKYVMFWLLFTGMTYPFFLDSLLSASLPSRQVWVSYRYDHRLRQNLHSQLFPSQISAFLLSLNREEIAPRIIIVHRIRGPFAGHQIESFVLRCFQSWIMYHLLYDSFNRTICFWILQIQNLFPKRQKAQ